MPARALPGWAPPGRHRLAGSQRRRGAVRLRRWPAPSPNLCDRSWPG